MEFKADLSLPRSLIDTTRVRKPTGYIRLAPYSIWTKYGEEPVYDRTVEGRPKEQKIYWTFNPYRSYYNDDWSPTPSTGSMYQMNTSPVGPAICINNFGLHHDPLRDLQQARTHPQAQPQICKCGRPTRTTS